MQDWNEMQILARVAARMNITRAAEDLNLPKSTVSRALTRLEIRLGLKLLERTTRRLKLTEAGQQQADLASQMATLATNAERNLSELKRTPSGPLRITSPTAFLRTFLAPTLHTFLESNHQVTLEFINPAPNAEADIYLRAGAPPEDSNLNIRILGRIPVSLFASPRYLRDHGHPKAPEDLVHHATLGVTRNARWQLRSSKQTREITLKTRFAAPDPAVLATLAGQHCGITLIPLWLAVQSKLVPVLPGWQSSPVELMALYPAQSERLPKTRAFLDYLKSAVETQIARL